MESCAFASNLAWFWTCYSSHVSQNYLAKQLCNFALQDVLSKLYSNHVWQEFSAKHCCNLVLQAAAAGKWADLLAAAPVVSVTASSTFGNVVELLAVKGLHRVYVVNSDGTPVSIITLTDVLRLITKPPVVPPQPKQVMDDDDTTGGDSDE